MQLTPQGIPAGVGHLTGPPGSMQMVQVTPVPSSQTGTSDARENLRAMLQSAGLERYFDVLAQHGLDEREAISSLSGEQLNNIGIPMADQQ